MLAIDLPVALLILGVLALVASTTFRTVPSWLLRRKPTVDEPPAPVVTATYRRVITGRPASLDRPLAAAPNALAGRAASVAATLAPHTDDAAAGRTSTLADIPEHHRDRPDVVAAQALIDHYVDSDPNRMANLLQRWIHHDPPGAPPR